MTIEDLARYIDTIAPDAPGPREGREGGGGAHERTPPRRARVVVTSLAAATIAAVVVVSVLAIVDWSDPDTEVSTGPADGVAGTDPPWIGWPRTDESGTADQPGTTEPPHVTVTMRPPGGPARIEVGLTEASSREADHLFVHHLIGFTLEGYGFDAELHEAVEVPFDPCPPVQPCTEVHEPVVSPTGMVVRSWAPTLLPGASPTTATSYTVEPADGDVALRLHAHYAGAPISGEELALAIDQTTDAAGRRTFVAKLGSDVTEATWWDTSVRPASGAWILAFAPDCEGADACALGVGGRSVQVSSAQNIPYEQIVASLSVEAGGG